MHADLDIDSTHFFIIIGPGKPGDPLIEPLNGTAIKVTFKLPDESHGGLPNKYHVYHVKQGNGFISDENLVSI